MTGPLDAFRLDDRVVVITGASSGLGLGFARAVAAVGGRLVLGARRLDRLEELASALRAAGASVLVQAVDVTVPEQCQALVDAAVAAHGRVDVLVNNAGLGGSVAASRETPEGFRQVIDVNLNGSFWMAQACARVMPPGSSIVNVSSVHGMVASRYPGASYAASKAGVIGLTRDLAQQWSRRKGIRVNALCPGYFATEMTTAHGADKLRAMVAEHSLLGRFGEQPEVDSALLFLASRASSYVTGTTLVVDGGLAATV
ncbi:SDR family NAD(P)-dependent oxidoreductase [Dactylosporangium sp. NPDC051541]|uniref:SDR family NAD(P)-dependent oxidoreductase n=1 Tax=Dactylosporangium sp. NPDC051541 TaxID=3363977 RepID=UPI0037B9AA24